MPDTDRNALKLASPVSSGCFAALLLTACTGDRDELASEGARTGAGSLATRINAETRAILPSKPGQNWIFDAYVSRNSPDVAWSRSWTKAVDFSGVAWEQPQTLTMVSPRHAVMGRHYQRPPQSQFVIFHQRNGREVQRTIIGREFLTADIAVVLLHDDVPAGIKTYPVLAPSDSYAEQLPGALALVTDRERKVHVHAVRTVNGGSIAFTQATSLPEGFFEALTVGDSGNPAFLIVRGQPVLIETHTTGGAGAGPFYGDPTNVEEINTAMRRLSEAHDAPVYQLRTVSP